MFWGRKKNKINNAESDYRDDLKCEILSHKIIDISSKEDVLEVFDILLKIPDKQWERGVSIGIWEYSIFYKTLNIVIQNHIIGDRYVIYFDGIEIEVEESLIRGLFKKVDGHAKKTMQNETMISIGEHMSDLINRLRK